MLKYIGHCSTIKYATVLALFETKNMNMDSNIFYHLKLQKISHGLQIIT
jgi:hypothetical protein